jgi:hypothetical protein
MFVDLALRRFHGYQAKKLSQLLATGPQDGSNILQCFQSVLQRRPKKRRIILGYYHHHHYYYAYSVKLSFQNI